MKVSFILVPWAKYELRSTSSNRDFTLRKLNKSSLLLLSAVGVLLPKELTTGNVSRTITFHCFFLTSFFKWHHKKPWSRSATCRLFFACNLFKVPFTRNYWTEWIVLSHLIGEFFQMDKINQSSVLQSFILRIRDLTAKGCWRLLPSSLKKHEYIMVALLLNVCSLEEQWNEGIKINKYIWGNQTCIRFENTWYQGSK